MNEQKHIIALDGWRFVFAILVLFTHVPIYEKGDVFIRLGFVGVTFFFILSGFLSVSSDTSNVLDFYKKKFFRIFPIHWIVLFLILIIDIPIRSFWKTDWFSILIRHLLLIQTWWPDEIGLNYYMNFPAWFLCPLLFFYALLPLLNKLYCRSFKIFTIVLLLCWATQLIVGYNTDWNYFSIAKCPPVRLGECMLGMWLAGISKKIKTISIYHCILATLLLVIFAILYKYQILHGTLSSYIATLLMAYLVISFANAHISFGKSLNNCCLWGGAISMYIYMLHFLVIRVILEIQAILNYKLNYVLEIILILFLTLLVAEIYKRYIAPWIKKMLG